jgi:preprotein translocase subunit YajC
VGFLLMMVVLFALMWFLILRPQQKRQRQQQALLTSLQPGQEVITVGGLYGTIRDVDIEEVVLEISDGVQVRVDKRAVVNVVEEEVDEPDEPAEVAPAEELAEAPVRAEQR